MKTLVLSQNMGYNFFAIIHYSITMISTNQFQKGLVIEIEGEPWQIIDYQFVSPGKGAAFMRTTVKNMKTGKVVEKSFKSGESFEEIELGYKKAVFLYKDRKNGVFSLEDPSTVSFDKAQDKSGQANSQRISLPIETIEWELNFLKPNTAIDLINLDGEIHGLKLPPKVELKVIEAPPAIKGNTATGGKKIVVVETGYNVNVPIFISEDEIVSINTQTGEYSGRT